MTAAMQGLLAPQDNDGKLANILLKSGEVLDYLEEQVVPGIWSDRVCGNSVCEEPQEFPAVGEAGCQADCGREAADTTLLLYMRTNFSVPGYEAQELQTRVGWNLCRQDPSRRAYSLPDVCWFTESQRFRSAWGSTLEQYEVPGGDW